MLMIAGIVLLFSGIIGLILQIQNIRERLNEHDTEKVNA